ncbi:delta-60 repeat domain-containing protein [Streptomyces bungoensis]
MPGDLNPAFGTGGQVTTALGGDDAAQGMALQADGKIVTVGYSSAGGEFVLARYNPNSSLDASSASAARRPPTSAAMMRPRASRCRQTVRRYPVAVLPRLLPSGRRQGGLAGRREGPRLREDRSLARRQAPRSEFAGYGTTIAATILDPHTHWQITTVPVQQLLAWADKKRLIAWGYDPKKYDGKGEFHSQLLLVTVGTNKVQPLSGFQKASAVYPGRWPPVFSRR